MQAGLTCEFIAKRWGQPALENMLASFAEGLKTEEALESAIGIDSESFDLLFSEHLWNTWGDLLGSLDDYISEVGQVERAIRFEDWVSVEALARDLIRRYPQRVGAGNPYQILAGALREQNKKESALDVLLAWHDLGGHAPDDLLFLVEGLREAGRQQEAVTVMESINWVMP